MSIVDDAIATMTHAQAEILRLRAINAELVAALEIAERLHQVGILGDEENLWDRAIAMRRAAIAKAKGETFTTGQARNGVAP